jgi:hypothetical protein
MFYILLGEGAARIIQFRFGGIRNENRRTHTHTSLSVKAVLNKIVSGKALN